MFSALHLFGTYSQYLGRTPDVDGGLGSVTSNIREVEDSVGYQCGLPGPLYLPPPPAYQYSQPILTLSQPQTSDIKSLGRGGGGGSPRRPRCEKKPIPDEKKDDKYYERRKRNNQAAKKSRDARRLREDQIALRASMLEHENAVLRAQVITLREEAHSLRQLLFHSRTVEPEYYSRSFTSVPEELNKILSL